MTTNKLFHITAITNLHVGSGKENIGVVDNLIQRDVITNRPIIHSSSLKGALLEHCNCETCLKNKNNSNNEDPIKDIFGSESSAGKYRFFDAHLLAIPVRSNKTPYLMATCPSVINQYIKTFSLFGLNAPSIEMPVVTTPIVGNNNVNSAYIEDIEAKTSYNNSPIFKSLEEIIGCDAPIVVLSDNDFDTLCDDNHLPVIARNQLNNGKNLWYEQVLPRFSVLYFPLIADDKNGKDIYSNFKNCIENCLVQIGANASVGYGFCELKDVTPQTSNK